MQNLDWLSLTKEEIIEPDLPICDPHHHLWDYETSRYLLDDILEDTASGHNIVSTVFMECGSEYRSEGKEAERPLGETEFVLDIAKTSAENSGSKICQGIVGYADLSQGRSVENILKAHLEIAPDHFKGIRHATGWHETDDVRNSHTNPSKNLMSDPVFREGFEVLSGLGLSFDAWFYHEQIPEFIELAKAFPETTIVLDHFGGPLGIGPYADNLEAVFFKWQRLVEPLANLDNVYFKLGGLNMKINGFNWHHNDMPPTSDQLVDRTQRYYDHAITLFGCERCMFESNFPVDKDSVSYHVLWNAFKKMSHSYSSEMRADLFYGTAAKVYRLG